MGGFSNESKVDRPEDLYSVKRKKNENLSPEKNKQTNKTMKSDAVSRTGE